VLRGIHTARRTAQQSSYCLRSIAVRRCTALRGAARRAVWMPHLFYSGSITAYMRRTAQYGAALRRTAPCSAVRHAVWMPL